MMNESKEVFALQLSKLDKRGLLNLKKTYLGLILHMESNCNIISLDKKQKEIFLGFVDGLRDIVELIDDELVKRR